MNLMAIFLYSHYFSAWCCIDIVRRNSVLVTHRSYPKWSTDLIPRNKKCIGQNLKKICECLETRSLKMESRNESLVTRSTVNRHLTLTYRQKAFWPQPSENFFGGITRTAIWSNFGFSAKSYPRFYWFCFSSLCDWSRKLTSLSQMQNQNQSRPRKDPLLSRLSHSRFPALLAVGLF